MERMEEEVTLELLLFLGMIGGEGKVRWSSGGEGR